MTEYLPPRRRALSEALDLSGEILRNVELSDLPLTNIALKVSRLAHLLNDFDVQRIMVLEVGGYPKTTPSTVSPETWELAVDAGRIFFTKIQKQRN